MPAIILGELKENASGGWLREATVNGHRYQCSVRVVGRVKVSYLGGKKGNQWEGAVYDAETGRCLFAGRCSGSIGVRGLLKYANLLSEDK